MIRSSCTPPPRGHALSSACAPELRLGGGRAQFWPVPRAAVPLARQVEGLNLVLCPARSAHSRGGAPMESGQGRGFGPECADEN
jgi:hypothetical protein